MLGRESMSDILWLRSGGDISEVSNLLDYRVQEHLSNGDYTCADISYISKVQLNLISDSLDVSDELLEKFRRMCQLWNIEFVPQEIKSHRKIIGPLIVAIKKLIFPILKVLLKDVISQQRKFNAAVVDAVVNLKQCQGNAK